MLNDKTVWIWNAGFPLRSDRPPGNLAKANNLKGREYLLTKAIKDQASRIEQQETSITFYAARKPPSTGRITPVTMLAAGEARKTMAPTNSGG